MAQDLSSAGALGVIPPAALARIPGCERGERPSAVAALPGGTMNASFRVDTPAGSFVLRLNADAGAVLGADHRREAQLHAAAARAGVAPELLWADPAGRFMVMRFVAGTAWEPSDFARAQRLQKLSHTLRNLHAVKPPAVAPFDVAVILRGYSAKINEAEARERVLVESLLEEADTALVLCARGGRAATIVHNDLHHSNLIEGERLYLIDWEYAAVADPIFDLACILAYYPDAEPHAQELLDAAGLAAEVSLAVLLRARFLFMLLSFLWYRLRRLTRGAEADELAAELTLLRRLRA